MKIYIASPFFNEKEITNYNKALDILATKNLDIYAPLQHEVLRTHKSKKEWATETFLKDIEQINLCDAVVMLFYGLYSDSGTSWECGYAYATGKPVIVVHLHEGKSNCMINVGSYSNLRNLEELKNYDFNTLPKYDWYGTEIKG